MSENDKIKVSVDTGNSVDEVEALRSSFRRLAQDISKIKDGLNPLRNRRGGTNQGSNPGEDDSSRDRRRSSSDFIDRSAVRDLRQRLGLQARLTRQRVREEAAAARAQAESTATAAREVRARIAFAARMARQRASEEAESGREAARQFRETVRQHRYLAGLRLRHEAQIARERQALRDDLADHGRHAGRSIRETGRTVASSARSAAVATGLATATTGTKIVKTEADVDQAEVNARIYGGLTKEQARKLRNDWAMPTAEALGSSTSKMLSGYTEALKLGIPQNSAKDFAELGVKTSEAWGTSYDNVVDTFGTLSQILTSTGDVFDIDKLKSIANNIQYLAAKMATTPEKLIEYSKRGAGGAQLLGMSQEAGIAFGAASTSLGNRAGSSGELFDYTASRIIELPNLTKQKGKEGDDARKFIRDLGYGNARNMDRMRRSDPDAFLPDFMDRMSKIRDPKRKDAAIRFFYGREWLGEGGRMVAGAQTYKDAMRLSKEAKSNDAIGEAWQVHTEKLIFIGRRIRAGFLNVLGEFGKVVTPLAGQFGDYFSNWTAQLKSGGIADRFKASIGGLIEGLGFRDLPDLMRGIFGDPSSADAGSIQAWREAFRGFGAGLRDIGEAVRSAFSLIAGANAGPEELGRWAGRFVALGAALVVIGPALTALSALVGTLAALGSIGTGIVLAARSVGGIGAAITGLGAAATGALAGLTALTVFLARWFTDYLPDFTRTGKDAIRDDQSKGAMGWLWNKMLGRDDKSKSKSSGSSSSDVIGGSSTNDNLRGDGGGDDLRKRITASSIDGMRESITRLSSLVQTATFGGSGLGGGVGIGGGVGGVTGGGSFSAGGLLSNQTPGERLGNVGLSRRGILGGSGVTTPMLKGESESNAKTAYDFFRSKGLSHEATAGILASMKQESEFNPNARGDGGRAHGLFQHHPDRRAAIQRATGINMSNATVQQQLEGAWWEMNHGDAGAQRALKILKQPGISARDAGAAFVQHFERPAADERASRGAMAEGFARKYGGSISNPGAEINSSSKAAAAVDVASQFEGAHEVRDNGRLTSFIGREVRGAQNAWCAGFVNSSLKAVGINGTGSGIANSFLGWGKGVDAKDALRGDVLVEHRGKGVNGQGGHVGLATGRSRLNPRTGELELEQISGNHSDRVQTSWEKASNLAVRRSTEAANSVAETAEAARKIATPQTPTKPYESLIDKNKLRFEPKSEMLRNLPQRMSPAEMTKDVPLNPTNSKPIGGNKPSSGGGGGSPQIVIQGHNGDPETLANAVQKRLAEQYERRTTDLEHNWG